MIVDMDDGRVGELWEAFRHDSAYAIERELIQKIVQERSTIYWHELAKRPGGTNPREALIAALNSFGIDRNTWPERV